MLLPDPSVKAAAEFEKNAYTLTLPTLGFNTHEVVAVTPVLPGLLAFPALKLKFTALLDKEMLIESVRTACRVMVCAPEFSTCAFAGRHSAAADNDSSAAIRTSFACKIILIPSVLKTAQGREPDSAPCACHH